MVAGSPRIVHFSLCCASLYAAGTPCSLHAAPVQFQRFRPLSQAELYENRIRFRDGVPTVQVGLEVGVRELTVMTPGPAVIYLEGKVPTRSFVGPQATVTVRGHVDRSAAFRWNLDKEQSVAQGDRRGVLFSLGDRVLDTRVFTARRGPYASEKAAQARRKAGEKVVRTLASPAQGWLEVSVDGVPLGRSRHTVALRPLGSEPISWGERKLAGVLYAVIGPREGITVVNSVDIETLLKGVVPAEIFPSAPPAALEAQAIVARGAVLSMLGHRHFEDPFHVCDEQHCQVYAGQQVAQASTNQAILRTRGQVVVLENEGRLSIVDSVYSASCGGHTEANEAVWPQLPNPALRPKLDGPRSDRSLARFQSGIDEGNLAAWLSEVPPTYCARASMTRQDRFRWSKTIDGEALLSLQAQLGLGRIQALSVQRRGPGGRVEALEIRGEQGSTVVGPELALRRLFGGLRSGAFSFQADLGTDGFVKALRFRGAGFGHGVGLCQMGAIGRAEAGQSAQEILQFYYTGSKVVVIY